MYDYDKEKVVVSWGNQLEGYDKYTTYEGFVVLCEGMEKRVSPDFRSYLEFSQSQPKRVEITHRYNTIKLNKLYMHLCRYSYLEARFGRDLARRVLQVVNLNPNHQEV